MESTGEGLGRIVAAPGTSPSPPRSLVAAPVPPLRRRRRRPHPIPPGGTQWWVITSGSAVVKIEETQNPFRARQEGKSETNQIRRIFEMPGQFSRERAPALTQIEWGRRSMAQTEGHR